MITSTRKMKRSKTFLQYSSIVFKLLRCPALWLEIQNVNRANEYLSRIQLLFHFDCPKHRINYGAYLKQFEPNEISSKSLFSYCVSLIGLNCAYASFIRSFEAVSVRILKPNKLMRVKTSIIPYSHECNSLSRKVMINGEMLLRILKCGSNEVI